MTEEKINASDVPGLMDLVSSAASTSATVRVRIEGDGEPIEYERRPPATEIPNDAEYVGQSVDDANVYGAYKDSSGTIYITRMWAGQPAGSPLFVITASGEVIDRPS
ncbi:hypothetical protein EVC10_024 [Rhizobium phage RHph_Y25]|nr:hypothetical protein EVC10_024 [Rhizobium phage RHph_Y25]